MTGSCSCSPYRVRGRVDRELQSLEVEPHNRALCRFFRYCNLTSAEADIQHSAMNEAAIPCPVEDVHGDARWMNTHQRFILETKEREPDVLFVGDSLISHMIYTHMWETMFAPLHPLNFGIGGDQTQHVLWRLSNGELDNIKPKVVVLLIGTNNNGHNPDMIADGIMAIVHLLREKQPQAQIVVMGLLPRGHLPNPLRDRNATVNELLEMKLALLSRVQLVKATPDLVQPDGTISHLDMYDYLHLTPHGYQRVFEPIYDLILQLLAEADGKHDAAITLVTSSSSSSLKGT